MLRKSYKLVFFCIFILGLDLKINVFLPKYSNLKPLKHQKTINLFELLSSASPTGVFQTPTCVFFMSQFQIFYRAFNLRFTVTSVACGM